MRAPGRGTGTTGPVGPPAHRAGTVACRGSGPSTALHRLVQCLISAGCVYRTLCPPLDSLPEGSSYSFLCANRYCAAKVECPPSLGLARAPSVCCLPTVIIT